MKIDNVVKSTIRVQSKAIADLENDATINQIKKVGQIISETDGDVIFSGIGKSGDVSKKLVSTFNSIGISSRYVHPVEAFHGDIGVLSEDDVAILISNSGNTEEMVEFLEILKGVDSTTIAITSDPSSTLCQQSDYHIDTKITEEGAMVELIPMASATATMVIGDCLANILMNQSGFDKNDFAQYHPGGVIGKKLDFEIKDIMSERIEPVDPDESLLEASLQMSKGQKGIVAVVDDQDRILGAVTDGDLRREMSKETDAEQTTIKNVMTPDPVTIPQDELAMKALKTMEELDIGQIVLTNKDNEYKGIVHMRDLVREGIA
jgi:arabinose-5-phosphate isomerase